MNKKLLFILSCTMFSLPFIFTQNASGRNNIGTKALETIDGLVKRNMNTVADEVLIRNLNKVIEYCSSKDFNDKIEVATYEASKKIGAAIGIGIALGATALAFTFAGGFFVASAAHSHL